MSEFVNPIQILEQLGLKANMTAADFGCGAGGWIIPLAQKLEDGKVFAVDVQKEPLSALDGKAKLQGISNIIKITADVETKISGIQELSCDAVLMTDLLFQVENKQAVFQEAKRILKQGGKILVIEWNVDARLGPSEGRVSQQAVKEIAENIGLSLEKELKAGDYHYGLIFIKP